MVMEFQISSDGGILLWWFNRTNDTYYCGCGPEQCDIGAPSAPSAQEVEEEDNAARVIQAAWCAYTELKWTTIEAGLDDCIKEFNKKQMSRGTEDPTRDVGNFEWCYAEFGCMLDDHKERRALYHDGEYHGGERL